MYTHMYLYTYVCIHICIYAHMYVYLYLCIHICMHVCIHICLHVIDFHPRRFCYVYYSPEIRKCTCESGYGGEKRLLCQKLIMFLVCLPLFLKCRYHTIAILLERTPTSAKPHFFPSSVLIFHPTVLPKARGTSMAEIGSVWMLLALLPASWAAQVLLPQVRVCLIEEEEITRLRICIGSNPPPESHNWLLGNHPTSPSSLAPTFA